MDKNENRQWFRPLYDQNMDPNSCELNILLDGDFYRKGAWAGITDLIEMVYESLEEQNAATTIDQHNYELHMVLPKYRDALPLKYACLTDVAVGQERTRNFPLDRAYRIINGLIDLLLEWKQITRPNQNIALLVKNVDKTQHLANKCYTELARRASMLGIFIYFEDHEVAIRLKVETSSSDRLSRYLLPKNLITLGNDKCETQFSEQELDEAENTKYELDDNWEEKFLRLNQHYLNTGEKLKRAQLLLQATCFYNHFGYYFESGSLVDDVKPYFNEIVGDKQLLRWDYLGNMFQGLITTGRQEEALNLINEYGEPFLEDKELLAKMHYLLAMVYLRYLDNEDIAKAEEHLINASACIRDAKDSIALADFYFLTVFINNGVAFLRVKQQKPEEAIKLCQEGYELLSQKLGAEEHKLHRSVLLYNSAQVYMMLGGLEKSLEFYLEAIKLDPYYSEYYNEMGNIYQRLEMYELANQSYVQALTYSAPYAEAYFNQGLNYFNRDDYDNALACLKRSEEIDPDQADLYLIYGEIYEERGSIEPAIKAYSKTIALDAANITAYLNRAVLFHQQGNSAQAEQDLKQAITIDPNNQDARDNLEFLHKEMAVG
jgi:tetratricopeptide (TPR) repeat protein